MSEPQDTPLDYDRMSLDEEGAMCPNYPHWRHSPEVPCPPPACLHRWEKVLVCAICGESSGLPKLDFGKSVTR